MKLTFAKGAAVPDPAGLFNSSLDGNVRRAIDIHAGEELDPAAFKELIRAAAAVNAERVPAKRRAKAAPWKAAPWKAAPWRGGPSWGSMPKLHTCIPFLDGCGIGASIKFMIVKN